MSIPYHKLANYKQQKYWIYTQKKHHRTPQRKFRAIIRGLEDSPRRRSESHVREKVLMLKINLKIFKIWNVKMIRIILLLTLMTIWFKTFIGIKGPSNKSKKVIRSRENRILRRSQETSNQIHRSEISRNTHTSSELGFISKPRLKAPTIGIGISISIRIW